MRAGHPIDLEQTVAAALDEVRPIIHLGEHAIPLRRRLTAFLAGVVERRT
jgi:hypothetical protein